MKQMMTEFNATAQTLSATLSQQTRSSGLTVGEEKGLGAVKANDPVERENDRGGVSQSTRAATPSPVHGKVQSARTISASRSRKGGGTISGRSIAGGDDDEGVEDCTPRSQSSVALTGGAGNEVEGLREDLREDEEEGRVGALRREHQAQVALLEEEVQLWINKLTACEEQLRDSKQENLVNCRELKSLVEEMA